MPDELFGAYYVLVFIFFHFEAQEMFFGLQKLTQLPISKMMSR